MAPFVGLRRHAPLAAQKGRRKSWGDSCCGDGKAEPSAPRCLQQGRSAPAPPAGPALPSFPPHSVWCEWFRSAPGTGIVIHALRVCRAGSQRVLNWFRVYVTRVCFRESWSVAVLQTLRCLQWRLGDTIACTKQNASFPLVVPIQGVKKNTLT